jgi:hypothetical protein
VALAGQRELKLVTVDERLIPQMSIDATLGQRMIWMGDVVAW